MTPHRTLTALVTCFLLLAAPLNASAQDDGESPLILRITAGTFLLGLLSTSTYVTVVRQAQLRKNEQMEQEIEELETIVLLEAYMRGHTATLHDDLAIGNDEALRDLAQIMLVPTRDYDNWRTHALAQRDLLGSSTDPHAMYHALSHSHDTCALTASASLEVRP